MNVGSNIGLAGCGMGLKIEVGCGIQRKFRSGMRDESILSGPGYAFFHGRDVGCSTIDGGIEDHKII